MKALKATKAIGGPSWRRVGRRMRRVEGDQEIMQDILDGILAQFETQICPLIRIKTFRW